MDERDYDPPRLLRTLPSWLLNRAAAAASAQVNAALAHERVRRHHFTVLLALSEGGPASQAALGRRLGIDRSDMAAVVAELERDELIARERDPHDRRRNVVTLTPAGAAALARLQQRVVAAQEALLTPLSADERAELARLLSRIVEQP
ncbi:MarR family transcriptional regulator [Conexibacter sp. JD483]|uniref:MarR family winged helix-turn-helix transcriptional regulator n=1 Tax=unclassified Conexibacter TaxID=2627773 RepID=UPI002718C820|nr:MULTISPECIES: MarR family transcriptional regulator [unclassified Conexibacter]MDO8186697.1 MarR family transcriptional regulator [Conexibacter sp. CPCC 205706]MDO8200417.1 MarR family transcriptional regulator [Conexibacter sp. CPCC 205762]MDR9371081.1 MarR family transcriptional regulator [Conexibacter sp. JD483]